MQSAVNRGKNADRTVKFECFSPEQLRERIEKEIEDLRVILGISVSDGMRLITTNHDVYCCILAEPRTDFVDALPME